MDLSLEEYLYQAIVYDDLQNVIDLLKQGANPNKILSHGKTCLGTAAYTGNTTILQYLLDFVISPVNSPTNSRKKFYRGKNSNEDSQATHGTSLKKSNLTAKSPNSCDDSADLEWDDQQPTVAATTAEDESCASMYRWYAQVLEVAGAALATNMSQPGPDCPDASRRTPLHHAAEQGHPDAVRMLIEAGADVRLCSGEGFSALQLAVARGRTMTVMELLSAGAPTDASSIDLLTPLHLAASRGFLPIVDVLLEHGANIEARDRGDKTALYIAAEHGHHHILCKLIESGANVNAEEIHGYTALCEAVWSRATPSVQLLLSAGARITHTHRLLHHAIRDKQLEMATILCQACTASLNLHDETGATPLLLAAKTCQTEMAEMLLNSGAAIKCVDNITGVGVVHVAVDSYETHDDFEKLLVLLLNHDVDLGSKSILGDTPLRRAILLQKDHCAAALACHGAPFDEDLTVLPPVATSAALRKLLLASGHLTPINMPLSLYDLSRIAIRNSRKFDPLYKFVLKLPLPESVLNSLLLRDVVL